MLLQAEYLLNRLAAERNSFIIELIFILLWIAWILWKRVFREAIAYVGAACSARARRAELSSASQYECIANLLGH